MYTSLFLSISFFGCFYVQGMENTANNSVVWRKDTVMAVQTLLPTDMQQHFMDTYILCGRQLWGIAKTFECGRPVNSAQFNKDETKVLTSCDDGKARIWNLETKQLISCFAHNGLVYSAQFNKDETKVLTASRDKRAYLWDAETGKVISSFTHNGWVRSAQFNKDETQVLTACDDGKARIWNLETKQLISYFAHNGWVNSAQFNKNETQILTACNDKNARIWDVETKQLISCFTHNNGVMSGQFNKTETNILTACDDNNARIWQKLNEQWSLEQVLLWKLLFTWFLVEKPEKAINSPEMFIKKIALLFGDTAGDLETVWNTFDKAAQHALWQKINSITQKYGK